MYSVIHQKLPNPVQSGPKASKIWVLDFPRQKPLIIDPLTAKVGSGDVMHDVDLEFPSKEQAIEYAKTHGIAYKIVERPKPKPVGRSYADNFAFTRKFPWTH